MFALVFLTLVAIDAEHVEGIPEVNWSDVMKNLIEKEDGDASFTEIILHRCYRAIIAGALKNQKIDDLSRSALHKMLKATKISPFDDAYVARSALIKMFDNGESIFAKQSFDFLKKEKIDYCEMSQPSDKLPEFDPKEEINLRWLALIASHRSYLAGKNDNTIFQSDLKAAIKKMREYAPRIVGIDLAGPEGYVYGVNRTKELVGNVFTELKKYVLDQEVQNKGVKRVVFRPHVGEGSSLLDVGCTLIEKSPREFLKRLLRAVQALKEQGEQFNGKHIRRILNEVDAGCVGVWKGERSKEATERAQKNLEAFITAIEANQEQWLKDKILIRFGHATHTTVEQAERMKKLGIYADINLGSNLRTGAIAYIEDLEFTSANTEQEIQQLDKSRQKLMERIKKANGQWNQNAGELIQKEHGLANLLRVGVKVVLGTDGQGVEVTLIEDEYELLEHYLRHHPDLTSKPRDYFNEVVKNSEELRNLMCCT
jgi:hypothetical protein